MWLYVALFALAGFGIGRTLPSLAKYLGWAWGASWFVAIFILSGFGPSVASNPFRPVDSRLWGGILLSFFLSITGITLSFPLGIALALGRQSKLPVIKWVCTVYIEIIRGAPLVTWLFMASLILPLMLGGITPPAVVRATVAIILFAAAYMAENVRGGLQSLPKGQYEAARALGLSAWDTTFRIILPQALRAVIPAIVGLFIGLFKDTSLVTIVGLSDLFETARKVSNQPETLGIPGGVTRELFIVMALFYWFFSYRMSVASKQLEKQLGLGTR
jgi:general L-amino acid transport system permease protein